MTADNLSALSEPFLIWAGSQFEKAARRMECGRILAQLRQELDLLNEAIDSIENLAREGKRGRGRPPAWMTKSAADRPKVPQPVAHMEVGSKA